MRRDINVRLIVDNVARQQVVQRDDWVTISSNVYRKLYYDRAPGIEVELFHGQQKAKFSSLGHVQRHGGVLLTSYQTLVNSVDDLNKYKGRDFTWVGAHVCFCGYVDGSVLFLG